MPRGATLGRLETKNPAVKRRILTSLTRRERECDSDSPRPGNGGVSGADYWVTRPFVARLPGPFAAGAAILFPATEDSLKLALTGTRPVHSRCCSVEGEYT